MINRPCDQCGKADQSVWPRYKVISGYEVALQRNEITGQLEGRTDGYWCRDCVEKENNK